VLVAVYGAAQPKFKEAFLTELVNTCSKESLPLLVGGGGGQEDNQDNMALTKKKQ